MWEWLWEREWDEFIELLKRLGVAKLEDGKVFINEKRLERLSRLLSIQVVRDPKDIESVKRAVKSIDRNEIEILKLFKKPPKKAHYILKRLEKKWQESFDTLKELGIIEVKDGRVYVNEQRLNELARYVPPSFSKPTKDYPDSILTRTTFKKNIRNLHGKYVDEVLMKELSEWTHKTLLTVLWIKKQVKEGKKRSKKTNKLKNIEIELEPPPAIDLSGEKEHLLYAVFLHKLGIFLETHPEYRYLLRNIVKLAKEFAKPYKKHGERGLRKTAEIVYKEIIKPAEDKGLISGGRTLLRKKRWLLAQELALLGLAMKNEAIDYDKTRYYGLRVRLEHQKDAPHLFPVHITPSEEGKGYAVKFNEKHPLIKVLREEKLL